MEKEIFKIEDLQGCSWALRKIKELDMKKNEIDHLAKIELGRVKEWQDKEHRNLESKRDYFKGLLHRFIIEQRQDNEKFSITTPYGKVWTRRSKPELKYDDKEMVKYLKDMDCAKAIRINEAVDKKALKEIIKVIDGNAINMTTGEVVEIVSTTPEKEDIVLKIL